MKAGGFDLERGADYLYASLPRVENALLLFVVPLGLVLVLYRVFVRRSASYVVVLAAAIAFAQLAFIVSFSGRRLDAGWTLPRPARPVRDPRRRRPARAARRSGAASLDTLVFSAIVAMNLFMLSRFEPSSNNVGRPAWTLPGVGSKLEARISGPNEFGFAELRRARPPPRHRRRRRSSPRSSSAWIAAPIARSSVMSGQAGMVPYYLFSKFGDRLRFMDPGSASTETRLLRCVPADQVTRNEHGALVSLDTVSRTRSGSKAAGSIRRTSSSAPR